MNRAFGCVLCFLPYLFSSVGGCVCGFFCVGCGCVRDFFGVAFGGIRGLFRSVLSCVSGFERALLDDVSGVFCRVLGIVPCCFDILLYAAVLSWGRGLTPSES